MQLPRTPSYPVHSPTDSWHLSFWRFLHTSALYADRRPSDLPLDGRVLVLGLAEAIPCTECRAEWIACTAELPCSLVGDNMFRWSVDVHNMVNKRLGKPCLCFEEALRLYSRM